MRYTERMNKHFNIALNKHLGWKLKRARKRSGISIEEAAAKFRISTKHLALLESGKRSFGDSLLWDAAKLYQIDFVTLFPAVSTMRKFPGYAELN